MPEPQTPPTAYAATAGGYRVPLRLYGASAQAPSLLVLPAMGLAAGFYAPLASALANAGINTVLFEQRGYGLSAVRAARRQNFGFAEWLRDDIPAALNWIAEQLPGSPVHLLGHSLGGHLAACTVALNPAAAQGLILAACGTPWVGAYAGKTGQQLRLLCALIPALNALFGYFPGQWLGFGGRDARRLMMDWRALALSNRYRAAGMSTDFEAGIANWTGQLLSLRFADDPMAPQQASELIVDKFARAEIERVVLNAEQLGCRADHFKWVRQPQASAAAIANWLLRK